MATKEGENIKRKAMSREHIDAITTNGKKTRDERKIDNQRTIEKIKKEAKDKFLPTLEEKSRETTNYIINLLKEKGEDNVNEIQIMSAIARFSLLHIATGGGISYTAQEIAIGFNLYLDMINKINEIKLFPPTVESFANFIGISREAYNNWLVDAEKRDIMSYIHSYMTGVLATSSLTGETKEISSIYLQKVMGKVEQQAPVVIKREKQTDIGEIQAQIAALKKDNIIDAKFEEK